MKEIISNNIDYLYDNTPTNIKLIRKGGSLQREYKVSFISTCQRNHL
jgi:hypothetical protein